MECAHCHKEFKPKRAGSRFCSRACHWDYWNAVRQSERHAALPALTCQCCGKSYVGVRNKKYCSLACCVKANGRAVLERKKAARHARGLKIHPREPKPECHCITCGAVLPKYKRRYCSNDCNPAKVPRGFCEVCGVRVPKGHRTLCSAGCRRKKHSANNKLYPSSNTLAAKIKERIGHRIKRVLDGEKRTVNYRGLVRFTESQLRAHFERKFQPGMSWDNYGKAWHIDHKIPVAAFNLESPEDIRRCWSLKNLQPLFCADNLKKGARLDAPFQPSLL